MLKAYLDYKNYITIECDKESSFKINGDSFTSFYICKKDNLFVYRIDINIDLKGKYIISNDFAEKCNLEIRYFVKNEEFDEMFYYDKDDLGANYSKNQTTFKLWAPLASKVLLVYEVNNQEFIEEMKYQEKGVFQTSITKDLKHALYYYKVTNNDITYDVCDPYSFSSTANSKRSAVIDLDEFSDENITLPLINNSTDCIIYEVSIRDFSASGELGNDVKGKFDAFLKHNLKSKNNHPIGIDYLHELGVSHIQFMPVLDFVTVDENDEFKKYNWGYDPFCYNVIEGSFSKNPNDPYLRIKEIKNVINELHKNNLRVTLDVVFNHTYFFKESLYNKIVPNYFYLMDRDGNLSNGSFCGNDIDTTRKMVYKYLKDMAIRYAKFYKIDGYRYDLMGILNKDLIIDIHNECKKINPSFISYGEGWNMPSFLNESLRASLNNANKMNGISFFNDKFRDIASGKVNDEKGFLNGNTNLLVPFLHIMRGSIENDGYFNNAKSSINYVECHDNYTLFDKLKIINKECNDEERNNIQLCCIASTILAQGIPFLHQGVEFNRSKFGNENSYNASDDINMIRWENVDIYNKNIKALKDFIKIRKEFNCFRLENRKQILNSIDGQILKDGVLKITYAVNGNIVLLIYNVLNKTQIIDLDNEYIYYANQYGFTNENNKLYKIVKLLPFSFNMFIK